MRVERILAALRDCEYHLEPDGKNSLGILGSVPGELIREIILQAAGVDEDRPLKNYLQKLRELKRVCRGARSVVDKIFERIFKQRDAGKGFCELQTLKGVAYFHGIGIKKDLASGVGLLQEIADQRFVEAYYELGLFYLNDSKKIMEFVKKIANPCTGNKSRSPRRPSRKSINEWCHSRGIGEFPHEACVCFKKAADLGHMGACYELGLCYFYGKGIPKNREKAFEWLSQAADLGHEKAQQLLKDEFTEKFFLEDLVRKYNQKLCMKKKDRSV